MYNDMPKLTNREEIPTVKDRYHRDIIIGCTVAYNCSGNVCPGVVRKIIEVKRHGAYSNYIEYEFHIHQITTDGTPTPGPSLSKVKSINNLMRIN